MYKVQNKLEKPVKYKGILFGPREIKELKSRPYSDLFDIQENEEKKEEPKNKQKEVK